MAGLNQKLRNGFVERYWRFVGRTVTLLAGETYMETLGLRLPTDLRTSGHLINDTRPGTKDFPGRTADHESPLTTSSNVPGVVSALRTGNGNSTLVNRLEARAVVRIPNQLRMHRALNEIGWIGATDEFCIADRPTHLPVTDPILITPDGTVLSGFGRWRLAVFECKEEIQCIEYPLNDDQSLEFILTHHQTRRGWNDFVRIRLSLALEPSFQVRALDNMRIGGRGKGLASLPNVSHIDVRQEIARAAGVCPRNVSNVKTILHGARPRLIEALREGMLTINRAIQLCKLPCNEQLKQFVRYIEERATNKVIRRSISRPKVKKPRINVVAILDALQRQEAQEPGSTAVRIGRHKRTVILIGKDLCSGFHAQQELTLI